MEPSADSDDDWLMELCVAPRPPSTPAPRAIAEGSAEPADDADDFAPGLVPAERPAALSAELSGSERKQKRRSAGDFSPATPRQAEPAASEPEFPEVDDTFQARLAAEFWRRVDEEEDRSAAISRESAPAARICAASASSELAESASAARRELAADNSAGASLIEPVVRNPFAGRPVARMLWSQIQADRAQVSFAVMERGAPSADDCLGWVAGLLDALSCGFKFGVSTCPAHRFFNKQYGYVGEGASRMVVLHCSRTREQAGALERRLIAGIGGSRCRNAKPGGEGLSRLHDGSFFTYVVLWL